MSRPDPATRALVVDDDARVRAILVRVLRGFELDVTEAATGAEALRLIAAGEYRLVLADLRLDCDIDGMAVLDAARRRSPRTQVLMITGQGSERDAVEAIKRGAADYLTKPVSLAELRSAVRLLLGQRRKSDWHHGMLGRSAAMENLFRLVERLAPSDLNVLVLGESGTGKELVARALHELSPRASEAFVPINTATLNPELAESELFGHERGAFTGAHQRREGRFVRADRGTLFFDEIGDMAPAVQAKVLRVLQEHELVRVGGSNHLTVDVRVIAATHRDLKEEVRHGRFRPDLFYRLRVAQIDVPPLRDRIDDIPLLANHFAASAAERHGHAPVGLSDSALDRLCQHGWPGNVRELRHVVEQAALLADGPVLRADDLRIDEHTPIVDDTWFSVSLGGRTFAEAKHDAISAFEREVLTAALRQHGGNVSRTAEALGMPRQSLQRALRRIGVGSRK